MIQKQRIYKDKGKPKKYIGKECLVFWRTIITFLVKSITAVFFKESSVSDALYISKAIFTMKSGALFKGSPPINFFYYLLVVAILVTVEFFQEYLPNIKLINNKYVVVRYTGYVIILMIILMIGVFNGSQFIYFQF